MSPTYNVIEDNDHPWEYDTLSVDGNGRVSGTALTKPFRDGHSVQISVKSISVEPVHDTADNGTHYIPIVTVIDDDGNIIAEPSTRDADFIIAESALEYARAVALDVAEHPDLYLT